MIRSIISLVTAIIYFEVVHLIRQANCQQSTSEDVTTVKSGSSVDDSPIINQEVVGTKTTDSDQAQLSHALKWAGLSIAVLASVPVICCCCSLLWKLLRKYVRGRVKKQVIKSEIPTIDISEQAANLIRENSPNLGARCGSSSPTSLTSPSSASSPTYVVSSANQSRVHILV